jgi:hypothetical protein
MGARAIKGQRQKQKAKEKGLEASNALAVRTAGELVDHRLDACFHEGLDRSVRAAEHAGVSRRHFTRNGAVEPHQALTGFLCNRRTDDCRDIVDLTMESVWFE